MGFSIRVALTITACGHPQANSNAVDVDTWGLTVLGPNLLDQWFGAGTAFSLWQNVKQWGSFCKMDNFGAWATPVMIIIRLCRLSGLLAQLLLCVVSWSIIKAMPPSLIAYSPTMMP